MTDAQQPERAPVRRVSLDAFKKLALDVAPAARAVLLARAHAQVMRERVDAYIRPVFDRYEFTYGAIAERVGRIPSPEQLYLCDDEARVAAFFAECDTVHRAHGFTGPTGHCPALRAEHLARETENALIDLTAPWFGIRADMLHYGDDRKRFLDLVIGAALLEER